MRTLLLSGLLLGASFAAVPASAIVIDFDSAPLSGCGGISIGGLDFTSPDAICTGVWAGNPVSSNGTPALIYGFGSLDITRTGGGLFTIGSFLSGISWYSAQTSYLINATAVLADNSTISGSFTIVDGFQTYNAGGPGYKKVTFTGLPDGYVAIDNLEVTFGAVPESASWALMIAGFGMVGFAMRRRETVVTA